MSAPAASETKDYSHPETTAGKKRKIEEVKTEDVKNEKTTNKKKKTDIFLRFQRYLDNIIVFHNDKEVHDIIDSIIDENL